MQAILKRGSVGDIALIKKDITVLTNRQQHVYRSGETVQIPKVSK